MIVVRVGHLQEGGAGQLHGHREAERLLVEGDTAVDVPDVQHGVVQTLDCHAGFNGSRASRYSWTRCRWNVARGSRADAWPASMTATFTRIDPASPVSGPELLTPAGPLAGEREQEAERS